MQQAPQDVPAPRKVPELLEHSVCVVTVQAPPAVTQAPVGWAHELDEQLLPASPGVPLSDAQSAAGRFWQLPSSKQHWR